MIQSQGGGALAGRGRDCERSSRFNNRGRGNSPSRRERTPDNRCDGEYRMRTGSRSRSRSRRRYGRDHETNGSNHRESNDAVAIVSSDRDRGYGGYENGKNRSRKNDMQIDRKSDGRQMSVVTVQLPPAFNCDDEDNVQFAVQQLKTYSTPNNQKHSSSPSLDLDKDSKKKHRRRRSYSSSSSGSSSLSSCSHHSCRRKDDRNNTSRDSPRLTEHSQEIHASPPRVIQYMNVNTHKDTRTKYPSSLVGQT